MSIREVREEISQQLSDALDVDCWSFPNEQMTPPCLFVSPGDPYLEPLVISEGSGSFRSNLNITVIAGVFDNESSLGLLEHLTEQVYTNIPKGYKIGPASAPQEMDVAGLKLLTLDIPVQATVTI